MASKPYDSKPQEDLSYSPHSNGPDRDAAPDTEGAEIGVLQGGFSNEILQTPVRKLHLIDYWTHVPGHVDNAISLDQGGHDQNERMVRERFAPEIKAGCVNVIKASSLEAAKQFQPGQLDWIFLDADHTYERVLEDLIAWHEKIKQGGVLMGHDYLDTGAAVRLNFGVIPAVQKFCREHRWKLTHLTRTARMNGHLSDSNAHEQPDHTNTYRHSGHPGP